MADGGWRIDGRDIPHLQSNASVCMSVVLTKKLGGKSQCGNESCTPRKERERERVCVCVCVEGSEREREGEKRGSELQREGGLHGRG